MDEASNVNKTMDGVSDSEALQRQAVAYHEAGHAVMALALGRSIHKVSIRPGGTQIGTIRLGVCEIQKGKARSSKNVLEDEVLIHYAGMVAEARFTGQYCRLGAAQDLLAIKGLLGHRTSSESQFERLQRRLLDKTEHLLGDEGYAKAIELVAGELLKKTTISGRAVRHYYEQALKSVSW